MLHFLKPYFYRRFKTSLSKSGEDIQLWQLLKKSKGTYIDIGGHHPIFGNNSYFFYIRKWRGIIVEPNPIFLPLYQKYRPEDVFISAGVGDNDGEMNYYEFESSFLNTFSESYIFENNLNNSIKKIGVKPVFTLDSIISKSIFKNQQIDFLSIDVEGLELEVVKGNDWDNFRPRIVLLESHRYLDEDLSSVVHGFLLNKEYRLLGKSLLAKEIGTMWYLDTKNF